MILIFLKHSHNIIIKPECEKRTLVIEKNFNFTHISILIDIGKNPQKTHFFKTFVKLFRFVISQVSKKLSVGRKLYQV